MTSNTTGIHCLAVSELLLFPSLPICSPNMLHELLLEVSSAVALLLPAVKCAFKAQCCGKRAACRAVSWCSVWSALLPETTASEPCWILERVLDSKKAIAMVVLLLPRSFSGKDLPGCKAVPWGSWFLLFLSSEVSADHYSVYKVGMFLLKELSPDSPPPPLLPSSTDRTVTLI